MDLSWGSIFKVLVAGLATYVLMPAFLILRDYVLWRVVNAFILNDKLRSEVLRYAAMAHQWNTKYVSVESRLEEAEELTVYSINGKHVTEEAWFRYQKEVDDLQKEIMKAKLYIDRKSRLLTWLFRHYKQETENPIPEWKKQARDQVEKSANNSLKSGTPQNGAP